MEEHSTAQISIY